MFVIFSLLYKLKSYLVHINTINFLKLIFQMRKFKVCIICQDICQVCKYSIDIFFGHLGDYIMAEMLMQ